jgi:putative SOS response-associated peptidase YedK
MPVITPEDRFATWLEPGEQDKIALKTLLRADPSEELDVYKVSCNVNSVKHNTPDNMKPVNYH